MNRLATLTLLAGLAAAPLAGCMGPMCQRVPADEMKEMREEAKKPVTVMLVTGDAIHDVKLLGWSHIGPKAALAVEMGEDRHILINADQIQAIVFDEKPAEPEAATKPDDEHKKAGG